MLIMISFSQSTGKLCIVISPKNKIKDSGHAILKIVPFVVGCFMGDLLRNTWAVNLHVVHSLSLTHVFILQIL